MKRIALAPLFIINGLFSLAYGIILWIGYGLGDFSEPNPTEIRAANMYFTEILMVVALIYMIVGSIASSSWAKKQTWANFLTASLAILHLFGITYVLFNRTWSGALCVSVVLVSIAINITIIWVSLKPHFPNTLEHNAPHDHK